MTYDFAMDIWGSGYEVTLASVLVAMFSSVISVSHSISVHVTLTLQRIGRMYGLFFSPSSFASPLPSSVSMATSADSKN